MSDLKERLKDDQREDEWARAWKPEAEGEMLTGTFERMEEVKVEHGTYPVAHIREDETGELRAVWMFHKVLRVEWEEQEPQPGDRVGIIYKGRREGQTYAYHHYGVEVEPAKAEGSRNGRTALPRFEPDEGHDRRPKPTLDNPNAQLPY